jgi:hypothetical protein
MRLSPVDAPGGAPHTPLKLCTGRAENRNVMPYVIRNPAGAIIGLADTAQNSGDEELALDHPEVQSFLEMAKEQLLSSDSETIRVIEDLVDALIQKKLILLTDLPLAAQQKLNERQRIRSELNVLENLVVEEEDIL